MIKIIKRICWKKEGEMNRLNSNIWNVQYALQKKLVKLAAQLTKDLAAEPDTWQHIRIESIYFNKVKVLTAELEKCDADVVRNHKIHSRWWSLEFLSIKSIVNKIWKFFGNIIWRTIRLPYHNLTFNYRCQRQKMRLAKKVAKLAPVPGVIPQGQEPW